MRLRTKLTLIVSVACFAFFIFCSTGAGYRWLLGAIPPDISHEQLENKVIGAGVKLFLFGFFPGLIAAIAGATMYISEAKRNGNKRV